MDNPRCRVQMSVSKYQEIKDKIVSKEDGEKRKEIDRNYNLVDNRFIPRLKEMFQAQKGPLIIASKDPSEEPEKLKDWFATNSGFIQGLTHTISGEGKTRTTLNDIQAYLVDCQHKFLFMEKTRQFGFSFILAARALSEAMLKLKHTTIFVSYNEEESKEKIMYAKELYESLPSKYKLSRKLKYDNKTSLVFEKSGKESAETRILSYPQRIIRGKGGDVHVRIDEAAHCIHFRKIYTSALPVLSRGSSSLWVGSSPAGKGDLFYEIAINQDNNYPLYVRMHVNWWDVPEFCVDVRAAREQAHEMLTDQRVEKFATKQLLGIRKSMVIEDFQQEYECAYLDETYSYYPWDLILKCTPIMNIEGVETPTYDADAGDLSANDFSNSGTGIDFYQDFDEFMNAVDNGILKGPFLGGFDVGRTTDASEVTFVEENENDHHQIVRAQITMKRTRLPEQRSMVSSMVNRLGRKLIKFGVDYNGIGMNIAEDLEDISYDLVVKLPFNSNQWKEDAAKQMKYRMHMGAISFPAYRPLLSQIHSIKRILLPGGDWRFDADKAAKHHGDRYWSVVAASQVGYRILDRSAEMMVEMDNRLFKKESKAKTGMIVSPNLSFNNDLDPYGHLPMASPFGNMRPPSYSGIHLPSSRIDRPIVPIPV